MNYYNPYFSVSPYTSTINAASNLSASQGLFGKLFSGGKFSSFINGTQKTLNIINQAIPLVKQVSPVMKNAKTMFKVMNEFKKVDNPIQNINATTKKIIDTSITNNDINISDNTKKYTSIKNNNENQPTFFL